MFFTQLSIIFFAVLTIAAINTSPLRRRARGWVTVFHSKGVSHETISIADLAAFWCGANKSLNFAPRIHGPVTRPQKIASRAPLLYDAGMGTERAASPALEAFIDKTIELAKGRGYNPTIFIGMRNQYGTVDAIERLVQSGDIQSGFKRLKQLKLLEWTIESAVTKFPTEFSRNAKQCAEWRLQQIIQPDSKNSE
jgi:hypothetical protein